MRLKDRMAPSIFKHSTTVVPQLGNLRRFEDLCQQCAHPHWHPDPNVSIFSNPALSASAAEQFRTLRSRLYQLRGSQQLRTLLDCQLYTGGRQNVCNQ